MSAATTPQDDRDAPPDALARPRANGPLRTLIAMILVALAFMAVGAQLVRLALPSQSEITSSLSETVSGSYARPDIVDRNGRLLASDVEAYSLFADPARVLDRDEVVEKLASVFSDLDGNAVRKDLSDRSRRFVWIRRGLSPRKAQQVHDLGLPGLDFRRELRRAYPGGTLAGHVLGYVNVDNRGVAGIERYVDESIGVDAVQSATLTERAPVRLSLDLGVQHAVESELADAMRRFEAKGAAGLVLDANSGEVLASASFPEVDPARPTTSLETARADKIAGSTFELGSVFKTVTLAMALEGGYANLDTILDVRQPLEAGRFTIRDLHPVGRPLSVAEVFVHSSNVGAAMLATRAGPQKLQAFLQQLGLLTPMQTEEGPIAVPQAPARWGQVETMTISYGHGLAVSPLQFAVAASALLNGGIKVSPTFLKRALDLNQAKVPLVSAATSARMRDLMRLNVTDPAGTGKRAAVPGYAIGGKTGTAEIPGPGGYREKAVISSFLAAFPIDKPKYLVFVLLFEPKPTHAAGGEVLAALNAAPTAGRIIARIGPVLGMMSASTTGASGVEFDGTLAAKYEAQ
ncbi:MAG: peptidoglycan D,D-transpeptidase FtsI family protein [Hyphomicrobium sp.]